MSQSLSRSVALMFLLVLALPATVLAQTEGKADLSGVLLDASGRPAASYPMKMMTPQGDDVIIKPTDPDGSFGVDGLPPGNYEFRAFEPGGSTDRPIASKKVTLAAGQKEKIEIRIGSGDPAGAAAGTTGLHWLTIVIPLIVLAGVIMAFFTLRSQRRPGN